MQEQIYSFLVGLLLGVVGGFFYELCSLARKPFHAKWVRYIVDFLFCAAFAGGYLALSLQTGAPVLRAYTVLACGIGFFLYSKSFHKMIAFFVEKIYNDYKGRTKRERRICRKGSRCPKKNQRGSPSAQP